MVPSGNLHIGNYFGAIRQWVELQNTGEYRNIFCVVDEHALTTPQDPAKLRSKILEVFTLYLALGLDPEKSIIFVQSSVSEHAELSWILYTITPVGELERMTQFKDKSQKQKSILAGLLNYPVLQAADILLYRTNTVPVGEDQLQHIEITRAIAKKFNNAYGQTFCDSRTFYKQRRKKNNGFGRPVKKMSKSAENSNNYIALLDSPEIIREKIKSAVTDSGSEIKYDAENKPAISNLLLIYSLFSCLPAGRPEKSIAVLEKEYAGKIILSSKKSWRKL